MFVRYFIILKFVFNCIIVFKWIFYVCVVVGIFVFVVVFVDVLKEMKY